MEKILPVAGATGSHSYVATEANPPSLACDPNEDLDYVSPPVPSVNDSMDINSTSNPAASISASTSTSTTNILLQPATKWPRLDNDDSIFVAHHPSSVLPSESGSPTAAPTLSAPSNHTKKSKKTSEKGKGKAWTGSNCSSALLITPSTSQCVDKVTPAVAIVELHRSIKDMTQAILVASKPPETVEDKAAVWCQEAVCPVQEHNDGLSIMEKATLIVFFGSHDKEADMYIALKEDELWQAVVRQ